MSRSENKRIFLSYASEDLEIVEKIYAGLIERRLVVWFDKKNLKPGAWSIQIMKAISRCRYFVICISKSALKKTGDKNPGFQDSELNRAFEIAMMQPMNEFTIVPIRIEDCDRGDTRITSFQQYDLFNNFEAGLDNIAVSLGGVSISDIGQEDTRSQDEKDIENLTGRAETLFYAKEYDEALNIFTLINSKFPNEAEPWHNKSITLLNLRRYRESLSACERALELDPKSFESLRLKGVLLPLIGEIKESIPVLDNAIKTEPGQGDAWTLTAKAASLNSLERYEEALSACEKAIEFDPNNDLTWQIKASSLRNLKRYEESLLGYEKALSLNPNDPEALAGKSATLYCLRRYEDALSDCEKAIELDPNNLQAWASKSAVYLSLGRLWKAAKAFSKARALRKE